MSDALVIGSLVVFAYFAVFNLLTLTLLAMSYSDIAWLVRGRQPRRGCLRPPGHRPGISLLVPAYNEQEIVVSSVSAMLDQEYAPLEVIVADDGSTDATFERLDAAFDLVELPIGSRLPLPSAPLQGVYISRRAPALLSWSLLECLWYHPLLAVWRTSGIVRLLIGRRPGWGQIPREALGEARPEALSPLTR